MKFEYGIILIMALLVSTTLFLIYQNPDETPSSMSLEKYSGEIVQINEISKKYYLDNDDQKFNNSVKLMQKKLKEIFQNYLELDISHVELFAGNYPFFDAQYRIEKLDFASSSICDYEKNIPLHAQKISQTDNFQRFTKKYSSYPVELIIMDERNEISNIHYGLTATNNANQSASTYFHLDSCTNEITDKEPYFLICYDGDNDYRFSTFNSDDIIASYSNSHFCKIELDSWRQSIYDYSKTLREKQRQLEIESMSKVVDQESQWKFISEMNKHGDLGNIVGSMVHGKYDEPSTQEMIKQYEKQYGSLPEELLELIEKRK